MFNNTMLEPWDTDREFNENESTKIQFCNNLKTFSKLHFTEDRYENFHLRENA